MFQGDTTLAIAQSDAVDGHAPNLPKLSCPCTGVLRRGHNGSGHLMTLENHAFALESAASIRPFSVWSDPAGVWRLTCGCRSLIARVLSINSSP